MKTVILIILALLISFSSSFSQTLREKAIRKAKNAFAKSEYSFHSLEFLPVENTYTYVLDKYYNIKWYFTDSLDYYNCYDSVMIKLLKNKYGLDFLNKARVIADSLDQTKNWKRDASYPGGQKELFKFIYSNLSIDSINLEAIKTRVILQIEIDSTGKVINPKIMRGINKQIDNRVIELAEKMPNWKPAYLYGKRIRQLFTIPIHLEIE
ncbi:energy transducer TonB [Marinifilum sp. D714]|uniref:energy transducer TonB n=1 Tax=Marinifilum sp. D714 TaxID=2937523 RepID=UPI0027C8FAB1|nr:energy transducer TonB [Marinifilum sp. D714]MDQ2178937.1 energy transducer TonB [Marinifilum sp. D714]